ncbi:MBL fold metallo-hydrolase [Acidithiobacillus ferrianus]|uniref:MBL fold metallo-hydrolase n=1 Tax=Acidithiobacillus ferrianus TaxID=2678518 RepID=UPI0034E4A6C3
MEMQFYGAAGGVTGSCHFLGVGNKNILIDCGMFQGGHDLTEENRSEFGFDARDIHYLLLTHAHLDHCGRIPLLVKRGFRGEIIATAATRELARLVLMDAAGLATEEARRSSKRRRRQGGMESEPLYTITDVLDSMDRFGRTVDYDQTIEVCPGVRATFGDAGHILGSAWVLIEASTTGKQQRIVYSGDLGNRGDPILNPPSPAPEADVIVMETTYGDRLHKAIGPSVEELRDAILDTLERGGDIIIPTFALERAQGLLYHLRQMMDHGKLPANLPVFLDSPMAISATEM